MLTAGYERATLTRVCIRTTCSYSLALSFTTGNNNNNVTQGKPIRVYTVLGKKEQGRFALEVAKRALAWYEEFFDYEVCHTPASLWCSPSPPMRSSLMLQ